MTEHVSLLLYFLHVTSLLVILPAFVSTILNVAVITFEYIAYNVRLLAESSVFVFNPVVPFGSVFHPTNIYPSLLALTLKSTFPRSLTVFVVVPLPPFVVPSYLTVYVDSFSLAYKIVF